MQNSPYYVVPQRNLPKPTSSGVLSNNFEESANKRQKGNSQQGPSFPHVQSPEIPAYSPLAYYTQPYIQPYTTGSANHRWSPQPYFPSSISKPSYSVHAQSTGTELNESIEKSTAPEQSVKPILYPNSKESNAEEITVSEKTDAEVSASRYNDDSSSDSNYSAEEDSKNTSEKVLTVPGTSITLTSEAEIEKWRSERKKMWLLKISNNKLKHMDALGIKEHELKAQKSVLQESKKQKQFIQNIQAQVNRVNPKANLNVRIVQREMAEENSKLLQFIKELGDANLLKYELTQDEKDKLFGTNDSYSRDKKYKNNSNNYKPKGRMNANKNSSYRHR